MNTEINHQVSSGVLVVKDDKLLLVHHVKANSYNFWVPPGGSVEGREDVRAAAIRETEEETGLQVRPLRLAYLQEGLSPGYRLCKFWFYCELVGGNLAINSAGVMDEDLVAARFVTRAELQTLNVLPALLKTQFWEDLAAGFEQPEFLGVEDLAVH